MSDKEADLQIKEQLELYSDFIKFAWDSLDDNILTDDDNENVDMSLEAFFNLVKIACIYNGNRELYENMFKEMPMEEFESVHETLSIISDFLDETQPENWDEEINLLDAFDFFAETAYRRCLNIKNENDERVIILISKELQECADVLSTICSDAWDAITCLEDKVNELLQKYNLPEEEIDLVEKYKEFIEKEIENLNTYISFVDSNDSTDEFKFVFELTFVSGIGVLASECMKDVDLFWKVAVFMGDEEATLPDDFYSFYDYIEDIDRIGEQYYYKWDKKMSLVAACKSFHFRYINLLKMSRNGTDMDVIAQRSKVECEQLLHRMEEAEYVLNILLGLEF